MKSEVGVKRKSKKKKKSRRVSSGSGANSKIVCRYLVVRLK